MLLCAFACSASAWLWRLRDVAQKEQMKMRDVGAGFCPTLLRLGKASVLWKPWELITAGLRSKIGILRIMKLRCLWKVSVLFSGLQKFKIHKAYGSPDHTPSAHTCFSPLDLLEYPSKQHLEERLLLVIHEANEGFGFG